MGLLPQFYKAAPNSSETWGTTKAGSSSWFALTLNSILFIFTNISILVFIAFVFYNDVMQGFMKALLDLIDSSTTIPNPLPISITLIHTLQRISYASLTLLISIIVLSILILTEVYTLRHRFKLTKWVSCLLMSIMWMLALAERSFALVHGVHIFDPMVINSALNPAHTMRNNVVVDPVFATQAIGDIHTHTHTNDITISFPYIHSYIAMMSLYTEVCVCVCQYASHY